MSLKKKAILVLILLVLSSPEVLTAEFKTAYGIKAQEHMSAKKGLKSLAESLVKGNSEGIYNDLNLAFEVEDISSAEAGLLAALTYHVACVHVPPSADQVSNLCRLIVGGEGEFEEGAELSHFYTSGLLVVESIQVKDSHRVAGVMAGVMRGKATRSVRQSAFIGLHGRAVLGDKSSMNAIISVIRDEKIAFDVRADYLYLARLLGGHAKLNGVVKEELAKLNEDQIAIVNAKSP